MVFQPELDLLLSSIATVRSTLTGVSLVVPSWLR
jgi:hypothetical protein